MSESWYTPEKEPSGSRVRSVLQAPTPLANSRSMGKLSARPPSVFSPPLFCPHPAKSPAHRASAVAAAKIFFMICAS